MTVKNYTGTALPNWAMCLEEGQVDGYARVVCVTETERLDNYHQIRNKVTEYTVTGIPEPEDDTVFIVTDDVAEIINREDFVTWHPYELEGGVYVSNTTTVKIVT